MALPAIVAGAAKALSAASKGAKASELAKGAKFLPRGGVQEEEREPVGILSTEGVIMLPLAIILDITGMILLCVCLDDFFLTDIIGIIFIGGWLLFRSGKVVETPKKTRGGLFKMDFLRKLFRGKYKRFLTPILGEIFPYVGALPFWTLAVYFELTD